MKRPFLSLLFVLLCPALAVASDPPGWKTESEAGLVITSGNTSTQSVNVKDQTEYGFDAKNRAKVFGDYLTQRTDGTTSAKHWKLGVRFDRSISDDVSLFLGQSVEGDPFKGLRQAYNTDLGTKVEIQKTSHFRWDAEGGYRYTRENDTTRSYHSHYVRAYTELEKKWNEAVSTKYWLEMLPNLSDSSDWQANSELSLSALLTSVFSLKTSYQLRYDHEPNAPGLKRADTALATALVAKF